jgi:hypothetical protein
MESERLQESERESDCRAFRELLRLAMRCVSPLVDGEEATYTQAEALRDLEGWLRKRSVRR